MADQEQLDRLLKQGVLAWNKWRKENSDVQIDLSRADLSGVILRGANFIKADLIGINLSRADISIANFNQAKVNGANLSDANLNNSTFSATDFTGSDLTRANLSEAHLGETDFGDANLAGANLSGAQLIATYLSRAKLAGVNFTGAMFAYVTLGEVDLRPVRGLETIQHTAPSTIGIDTIILSKGKIPEVFLKEAGVPPSIIEQIPSLVGSLEPIQFYSCFISYSSKDQDFAERLHADLVDKGVRCWYAPYDLKIGDKWRDRVEESIRLHEKLLLVLSHHSIESPRVEEEVVGALEKEERYFRETGVERLVLFPIRLDEAVMNTSKAWAANLHRLRHIGDFTRWTNYDDYQKAFTRLLRDLKTEAQKID
jgi:hypothetical protein